MNAIFFGTPNFVTPIVESLNSNPNINLSAVVTTPDKPVGRKQILTPSPVKQWVLKHKIPVFTPEKLDHNFITYYLRPTTYDLFIVAAYGKLIPPEILQLPKYGALGVHPSLLPKYRGASPVQAAILNNDSQTGITIFKMDETMDHGPIISQFIEPIKTDDTSESLYRRLFQKAAEQLPDIIQDYIKGKIKPEPQNHDKATFTKLLKKEDGYFDIENLPSKQDLNKLIRAYYPWPNAWTRWQGKIVKFYPNNLIQIEGKKPIKLEEFLKGYPNFPLKSF